MRKWKIMKYKYSLLLLITAIIWGAAFVAQSAGMDYVGPFTFNTARYYLGVIALLPVIVIKDFKSKEKETSFTDKRLWIGGVVCGIFLFLASSVQQLGIVTTTAGKAGFITAFYVVLVPVFSLALKKKPGKLIWLSVTLALVGLYFLCIKDSSELTLSTGDIYLFACAVLFSFQILAIDRFAGEVDCIKLAFIEFLTSALLGTGLMIWEHPAMSDIFSAWIPIGYAGVFSCGVAYTLQMVAQKKVKPAVASILMSLESVFSVTFGAIILREILSFRELIGCGIMFLAVLLAELGPAERKENAMILRKGKKVYLREMTAEDTDDIVRWRNADFVVKNFIYRKPVTKEDHLNWIETKVKTGLVRQFIVCLCENNKSIGSIYFRDIDNEAHTCEFGIFIGEPGMSGKGYGYEGQKLSMDIAFNDMGMETVGLRVLEDNKAAVHIYEKCGFKVVDGQEEFTESGERVIFMRAQKP